MSKHATQGRQLVILLQRRAMTYADMLSAGCGLSPWRRVKEALRYDPTREVVKGKRRVGDRTLVTWRVRTVKA